MFARIRTVDPINININKPLSGVTTSYPLAPPINASAVDNSIPTPSKEIAATTTAQYRTALDPLGTGDGSFIATKVGDFQSMVNEALMHQRAGLKGTGMMNNMPLVPDAKGLNSGWTSTLMDSTKVDGLLSLSKGEIKTPEQVKSVAQEFEGYFIGMLLKQMWKTIPKSGLTDTTFGSTMYREWYLDELASKSAKSGQGFGLSNVVEQVLLKSLALSETEPGPFSNALDQLTKLGLDSRITPYASEGTFFNPNGKVTSERQYQSVVNSLPTDVNPLDSTLTPAQRLELNRAVSALSQMPADLLVTGPREQNLTPVKQTDLLGF